MGNSDEKIIQRVLAGDKNAFGQLIDEYSGLVYAICFSYTKNAEDAKDLSQETFIKAFGILKDLKQPAAFRKWLSRIATSVSINWTRREPKTMAMSRLELGSMVVNAVFGSSTGEDDSVHEDTAAMAEALDAALDALPESFRVCLMLKYLEGLSYSEIADFLDIGVNTVKNRMHHAKIMLKNKLVRYERFSKFFDVEELETEPIVQSA